MQHTWKGTFAYDEADYGKNRSLQFKMVVELVDGEFTGTWWDEEYSTLSSELGKVKGSIKDDFITFVLNFPVNYLEEENGDLRLDYSTEPYDVYHDGFFDERSNEWQGNWEFKVTDPNGYYYLTGEFALNRDSEAVASLSRDLNLN